ncbi:heat-shock protein Hsp20 [Candidatus Micrarchaeota archaeon CG11_big_fil_rev_8_21_14_0_20_47_5]|nr:MAG: hypothetical protein AUJ17_00160 [Candidatus Micrarchaeota archaeon CG1_02_47_40]PIN83621.1 MAG: heat-shock protein Hsp20 [Candidatus Micrarchaeota archaeon CG11_big_fil_rev_8_21_14_0_20_47_5]
MPLPLRRKGNFNPFEGDFEGIFERMNEEMRSMMENVSRMQFDERGLEKLSKQPGAKVYGFSMRMGQDGKPVIHEFGNIRPSAQQTQIEGNERAPLVDVIDDKDEIVVIAELPGVEKKEIELNAASQKLSIRVENPKRKYSREVELPKRVLPESAKAAYKNGVLEVRLKKAKEEKKPEGKEVKID